MNKLSEALVTGGGVAIHAMIAERREETPSLEFKALKSTESEPISKEGRQRLAKALCGMANADGGTVVVGIQTQGSSGLDRADHAIPSAAAVVLRDRIEALAADVLDPQLPGIEAHAVLDGQGPSGFVVIDVPKSEFRPHMSRAKDQYCYFRRGLIGTSPMTNTEVRDLVLAPKLASVDLKFILRSAIFAGYHFGFSIDVELFNSGRTSAVAPFVKVGGRRTSPQNIQFARHQQSDSSVYIASTRDLVLHPEASILFCSFEAGIKLVRSDRQLTPRDMFEFIMKHGEDHDFLFHPKDHGAAFYRPEKEQMPELVAIAGAENAAVVRSTFLPSRRELLGMMYQALPST